MNKKILILGVAAGVGMLGIQCAQGFEIEWGAIGDSQLVFNGKDGATPAYISFQHSTTVGPGFDFQVALSDGRVPYQQANADSAIGDFGRFDGTFNIGSVTKSPNNDINGIKDETAEITGSATVTIVDKGWDAGLGFGVGANVNHEYHATVTFDSIQLVYKKVNPTMANLSGLKFGRDGISSSLDYNVTGGTYTGTQADLVALAKKDAILSAGWSFNYNTLGYMTSVPGAFVGSAYGNFQSNASVPDGGNFQSNASIPDGGMTFVLLGFALSGVVLMKRQMV